LRAQIAHAMRDDDSPVRVWFALLALLTLVALAGIIVTWLSRKAHGG